MIKRKFEFISEGKVVALLFCEECKEDEHFGGPIASLTESDTVTKHLFCEDCANNFIKSRCSENAESCSAESCCYCEKNTVLI